MISVFENPLTHMTFNIESLESVENEFILCFKILFIIKFLNDQSKNSNPKGLSRLRNSKKS